jgi:ferrous iron transport protein A
MSDGALTILPLSRLTTGRRAVIYAHEETDLRITLLEMGCIPGEPVWVEMVAPLGDPIAIRIAGYYLSIRKRDAEKILVSVEQ